MQTKGAISFLRVSVLHVKTLTMVAPPNGSRKKPFRLRLATSLARFGEEEEERLFGKINVH